jgi:hypothetical protein
MSDSESDDNSKDISNFLERLNNDKIKEKYKVLLDLETWLIKEGQP